MRYNACLISRALFCALLVFSLLLTGCWDRRETSRLAIITGVGVDWLETGEYKLTAQVVVPKSGGSQFDGDSGVAGKDTVLADSTSPATRDAFQGLGLILSRFPFVAHTKVLIFGQALARHGIGPVVDVVTRLAEPRETMWVAVSTRSAAEALAADAALSRGSAIGLDYLFRQQAVTSQATATDLSDLLISMSSDSGAASAPLVDAVADAGGKPTLKIAGTAVFLGDKLVGILDTTQSRGLLLAKGRTGSATITAGDAQGVPMAVLSACGTRTTIRPYFNGLKPAVEISITANANFDQLLRPGTLADEALIAELCTDSARYIEETVRAAVSAAQGLRADVFGFADEFHRSFRKQWRDMQPDWSEQFAHLEVDVHAKVRIRRNGVTMQYPNGSGS
ncbi:MAG: Ger(x)C family spore germination protein [Chloroflexota bacterium]